MWDLLIYSSFLWYLLSFWRHFCVAMVDGWKPFCCRCSCWCCCGLALLVFESLLLVAAAGGWQNDGDLRCWELDEGHETLTRLTMEQQTQDWESIWHFWQRHRWQWQTKFSTCANASSIRGKESCPYYARGLIVSQLSLLLQAAWLPLLQTGAPPTPRGAANVLKELATSQQNCQIVQSNHKIANQGKVQVKKRHCIDHLRFTTSWQDCQFLNMQNTHRTLICFVHPLHY